LQARPVVNITGEVISPVKDHVILEGAQIMIPPKSVSQSITLGSAIATKVAVIGW